MERDSADQNSVEIQPQGRGFFLIGFWEGWDGFGGAAISGGFDEEFKFISRGRFGI